MRSDARKNYDQILGISRDRLVNGGADTSLRDVARTAGAGPNTMYDTSRPTKHCWKPCFAPALINSAREPASLNEPIQAMLPWYHGSAR